MLSEFSFADILEGERRYTETRGHSNIYNEGSEKQSQGQGKMVKSCLSLITWLHDRSKRAEMIL